MRPKAGLTPASRPPGLSRGGACLGIWVGAGLARGHKTPTPGFPVAGRPTRPRHDVAPAKVDGLSVSRLAGGVTYIDNGKRQERNALSESEQAGRPPKGKGPPAVTLCN